MRSVSLNIMFVLTVAFYVIVWIAGGGSRADISGQILLRATATLVIGVIILLAPRPILGAGRGRPVAWLLAASILLAVLQLVPLPPAVWQNLPGRAVFSQAASLVGEPQPWRPLSLVPGATLNAATALLVPLAMLLVLGVLTEEERARLPGLLLALVAAASALGVVQSSGASLDNPFVNDTPGVVSGPFANRNHFGLFVSYGFLAAPAWAFNTARPRRWRGLVAIALAVFFMLTILITGSRAGLIVGMLGLGFGLLMSWDQIGRVFSRSRRWVFAAIFPAILATGTLLVAVSLAAGRAASIDRLLASDPTGDLRQRALPTIFSMIRSYFPAGSGLGGFDPVFRIHEPFALLGLTYLNHAHNDILELILDAGAAGVALLGAAVWWWAAASLAAWRPASNQRSLMLPRLGSAMLLLTFVASLTDYPARTPLIMIMMLTAGVWLDGIRLRGSPALRRKNPHL